MFFSAAKTCLANIRERLLSRRLFTPRYFHSYNTPRIILHYIFCYNRSSWSFVLRRGHSFWGTSSFLWPLHSVINYCRSLILWFTSFVPGGEHPIHFGCCCKTYVSSLRSPLAWFLQIYSCSSGGLFLLLGKSLEINKAILVFEGPWFLQECRLVNSFRKSLFSRRIAYFL